MKFELPPLDYDYAALEPHIGAKTVQVHYEKHHQGYIDALNKTRFGHPDSNITLKDIIRTEQEDEFNNAAQVWNHNLYWQCIRPDGGGNPSDIFMPTINHHFGSVEQFKKDLYDAAKGEFGSGWVWLVLDTDKKLQIVSSTDAENPIKKSCVPLFTIDVWEHAYYLDYMNQRGAYLTALLDHLINWDFIEKRFNEQAGE